MVTFNILGSCVCRDIFRLNECDEFKVNKFYQFSSLVSFCDREPLIKRIDISELNGYTNFSNFLKKTICADINKTVLSSIAESPSDYLIIDLCELRFDILKVSLGFDSFLITDAKSPLVFNKDSKIERFQNAVIEKLNLSETDILQSIDTFLEKITSIYNNDKIILIKNLPVDTHIDEQAEFVYYYNNMQIKAVRNMLSKFYNYFISKAKNIHILETPINALGFANHKWGKDPLHFVDSYYNYLFKAIKIIVNAPKTDVFYEREMLGTLCDVYEDYFDVLLLQKRAKFLLKDNCKKSNLLSNAELSVKDGELTGWKIICSKGAKFDLLSKTLQTSEVSPAYAILSQEIDVTGLTGGGITLSLEYETDDNTCVNIAITYLDEKDTLKYILVGNFMNLGSKLEGGKQIKSITGFLPKELKSPNLKVYVNRPSSLVKIYRVAMEIGRNSSLFQCDSEII